MGERRITPLAYELRGETGPTQSLGPPPLPWTKGRIGESNLRRSPYPAMLSVVCSV